MDNSDKFRGLNEELQKITNRLRYLDSWRNKRDVISDTTEYVKLKTKEENIEEELRRLIRGW